MVPSLPQKHLIRLLVLVDLLIREAFTFWWQRRCIRRHGRVDIGYWGIIMRLVGVVPVTARYIIALEDVSIETCVGELSVADETSVGVEVRSARPTLKIVGRGNVPYSRANNSDLVDRPLEFVSII